MVPLLSSSSYRRVFTKNGRRRSQRTRRCRVSPDYWTDAGIGRWLIGNIKRAVEIECKRVNNRYEHAEKACIGHDLRYNGCLYVINRIERRLKSIGKTAVKQPEMPSTYSN